ncbi:MAG TPA: glutamine-hydrolyzing GMP synthase [Anaerolineales bacterium]
MTDTIIILEFGSQYSQLIARRVRELQVYSELFPWDAPAGQILALQPKGFILSGGPASVYEPGAPRLPDYVLESGRPVLGICYGMQAMTLALGGQVAAASEREYGPAQIETVSENPLLPSGSQPVWMSHGDRIESLPPGFQVLARSPSSPVAAMGDLERACFGVQFHPEVHHTPGGKEILRRFVLEICGARPEWTPASIITQSVERVRAQVGSQPVLAAVSGGVDSSVAAALVERAVGQQLTAVFVDNGLLRLGEREQVEIAFRQHLGARLLVVKAWNLLR